MAAHNVVSSEIQAILSGMLGGARYGLKIRIPHALVMSFIFRRDLSSREKLRFVYKLAIEHASTLATFAALYKTILATLKYISRHANQTQEREGIFRYIGRVIVSLVVDGPYNVGGAGQRLVARPPGHPERSYHALVAGAVGGYFVFGRYSSVTYQMVLYLTSRVLVAAAKRVQTRYAALSGISFEQSYPLFSAVVWGLVMLMFEDTPELLTPSLRRSMDEIYRFQLPKTTALNSKNNNRGLSSSTPPVSSLV